jgi:hypothetical protein
MRAFQKSCRSYGSCLLLLVLLAGCRTNQVAFQFQPPLLRTAPDSGEVKTQVPASTATGRLQELPVTKKAAGRRAKFRHLPTAAGAAPGLQRARPMPLRVKAIARLGKPTLAATRRQPADQYYGFGYLIAFVVLVAIGILVLGILSGSVILALLSSLPLLFLLVLAVMSAMGEI